MTTAVCPGLQVQDWQRKHLRGLETRASSRTALSAWRGWEAASPPLPPRSHKDRVQGLLVDWRARLRAHQFQRDYYPCWGKNNKEEPVSPLWHHSNKARKGSLSVLRRGKRCTGRQEGFLLCCGRAGRLLASPAAPDTPLLLHALRHQRCSTVLRSTAEEEHELPRVRDQGWESQAPPSRQRGEGRDGEQGESFGSGACYSHSCHAGRKCSHTPQCFSQQKQEESAQYTTKK